MRVLVAEPLGDAGLDLLRVEHEVDVRPGLAREAFLAALPAYDALVVRSQVQVDRAAFEAGRRLAVVGRAGVGVDNVDLEAATEAGVVVVNAPTGNTIAAAEHTLALLFAVARRIAAADASMRRGEWARTLFTGVELRGRTLGIVGLGKIGIALADRARALEMTVVGHDPFVAAETAARHGVELLTLPDLLARADALTVHVPLTRATRGRIGAAELAALPAGAIVLNVARGGIIDEAALAEALTSGHLGGAGLDVFTTEPPAGSPLLTAPNTVLTPHLGASTAEAQARVAVEVAQQVLDVLAGRPARHAVNGPVVPPETAEALAPFVGLARLLGELYAQVAEPQPELVFEVAGEVAGFEAAPLVAAALSGLLGVSTGGRVNQVNAPLLARQRGLTMTEQRNPDAGRYASLLTLRGATTVAGTVASGEPRLVRLGEHWLDMALSPSMLITRHHDRPGTIGAVGGILGAADINISGMHLARSSPRADAFMILALDEPVPDAVAAELRRLDAVLDLWVVQLT
ncbi:MAG TPA: phosphoglycerate dehydrogenase [Candidatus Sulfotelmatobacter sp.]|nr:phosphoglycerate dehydrogenase [Candidatus Sulfotelmatobacter sp.]